MYIIYLFCNIFNKSKHINNWKKKNMATSSCPKCSNASFELKENTPKGSNYKFYFVQCASCGTVISCMEYISNNNLLYEVKALLENLNNRI